MKSVQKVILLIIIIIPVLIQCKKEDSKSSEKDVISFTLSQATGSATIDATNHSITVVVTNGTDLSNLQPSIEISPKATISPASGATVNFSSGPVSYTVTAEDNSTQVWRVSVTEEKSNAAFILTFTIPDQIGETVYGDSSVTIEMGPGTDLSALSPNITVSPKATISPVSGVAADFSSGSVTYIVTAENGSVKHYTVTVNKTLGTGKDILTFTLPGQVGNISKSTNWIIAEVDFTVNIKSLTPEITVSPGASISPASGETVDFSSGYADYTVTSENGKTKSYRVYINYTKISADNVNYQYYGRIDFTNAKKPKLWAAGSYIKAKFTGKYCAIALNDQYRYNRNNYIEYVIDNQTPVRLKTTGTSSNILVSDNLSDGEHTITICKNTEANIGYIEFLGLSVASLVALPAKPDRKIEFIGNSITCGCSSDTSGLKCGQGEWFDTDNAYMSYGAEVARRFDAQYHLTSCGGIGLIRSCCSMTVTMPDVFGSVEFNGSDSHTAWDFSKYIPDVVTISLGQNDGPQAADSAAFCSTYITFVGTIRSHYPDAQIVLLTSPMSKMTYLEKYIDVVVTKFNNDGDSKVSKYFFTKTWNGGCNTHPTIAQHQEIADELEVYLKTLMSW